MVVDVFFFYFLLLSIWPFIGDDMFLFIFFASLVDFVFCVFEVVFELQFWAIQGRERVLFKLSISLNSVSNMWFQMARESLLGPHLCLAKKKSGGNPVTDHLRQP